MPPQNPTIRSAKDGRITVQLGMLPDWLRQATKEGTVFHMVPLAWKRGLFLPDGYELDAYYAWHPSLGESGWNIDPAAVLAATDVGESFYLKRLMYESELKQSEDNKRLSAGELIKTLQWKSGGHVALVREPNSISIWTTFAYSYWHSRLKVND